MFIRVGIHRDLRMVSWRSCTYIGQALAVFWFSLFFSISNSIASETIEEIEYVDAELIGNNLFALTSDRRVKVWDLVSKSIDKKLSNQLSSKAVEYIATDGVSLWCIAEGELLQWNSFGSRWDVQYEIDSNKSKPIELAIVDRSPFVVFPKKVVKYNSIDNIYTYKVPNLKGQLKIDYLRILDMHVGEKGIWFATGQGEWGGHLVYLNTKTGKWSSFYDAAHYATGITAIDGGVAVSWAMSHFMADTVVRYHKYNTKPKKTFDSLDSKYIQKLAYDESDNILYGIEQKSIVSIVNGVPEVLTRIDGRMYENEPDAIGVAPGVLKIAAFNGAVIVVMRFSDPVVFDGSVLVVLNN